ncbi:unnamed protein product [Toxocara canis]|uniref:Helicase ATP-binding domain-containing protein n=1 Tax=Toxocara canis TaxID=6265 RepID=A0A183VBB1_TOXCA|nr:unnamed protein product [Toxocara canis]
MNREQRKFTHHIAGRLDLKSHSSGSEGNRQITISRRTFKPSLVSCMGAIETKPVELNSEQMKALSRLIDRYPIDQRHIANHLRSGFAVRRSLNSRNTSARMVEPMLVPPPTNENTEMRRFRETLPTFKLRQEILGAIRTHKVTLVTGANILQVPQFILEEASAEGRALRIVCTQPRRLPAIAVADRVAKERNERLGATVGYHIRLEQKTSAQTVLTYCTSGVLLRMLTIDDIAHSISHILLDEIHEREQNTDYLLIALKQALKTRGDLKVIFFVILMSATMEDNLGTFMRYFGDVDVAHVDIPSRLHHVEKFFLSEVLALTGYKPPPSLFGGTFSSTGFGQFHSQSAKNFDSFPHVDEFRCDAVSDKSSVRREYAHRPAANISNELISVRTAPNLGTLMSNGMAHQNAALCGGASFERCFGTAAATESSSTSTATLVTSASTSALQSHNTLNMQPLGDQFEKLAQTLADTNWNEV